MNTCFTLESFDRMCELIAVVDNDRAIRRALSSLLRSARYRCAMFESAEAFLASPGFGDIACVLLDVRLPGINGLELQRRLNQGGCRVPVIYVTALVDGRFRERALTQGATAYFAKPFDGEALLGAIGNVLRRPLPQPELRELGITWTEAEDRP